MPRHAEESESQSGCRPFNESTTHQSQSDNKSIPISSTATRGRHAQPAEDGNHVEEARDVVPDNLAPSFARTRQWALNLDEAEKQPIQSPPPIAEPRASFGLGALDDDGAGGPRQRGPIRRSASAPPGRQPRDPVKQTSIGPLFNKTLLEPSKPLSKPPGWRRSFINAIKHNWWLNILLVCAPISWALEATHQSSVACFVTAALAIIPLAGQVGFATEEVAMRTSDTIGGLLNATFGNAVELIISLLALVKGELDVVKNAMLGSILSNCLLVTGCCLIAAGLRRHEAGYGIRAAQLNINLLGLCTVAIVLPVAFHATLTNSEQFSNSEISSDLLKLSHGIAILLLLGYAGYLIFQLWTHAYIYAAPDKTSPNGEPLGEPDLPIIPGPQPPSEGGVFRLPSWGSSTTSSRSDDGNSVDKHQPQMSMHFSIVWLCIVTGIAGYTSEVLVSSINEFQEATNINPVFIALIILPVVGNAAEHCTSVTVAAKNKLNLSMSIAVGSSIQIALLILPLLVIIGWIIGQPLDLFFDTFVTIAFFVSICALNFALSDGRSNYLEGFTLCIIYVIIGLSTFFYPGVSNTVA